MTELITQVDEHDNILGVRPREDFYTDPSLYCRTSHLYLFNTKGELLIQKRAKTKRNYPNLYDASASGTVAARETYEDTMHRETQEELGISDISLTPFLKDVYKSDTHTSHKTCFYTVYEGPLTVQKEEVDSIHWMGRKQLIQEVEKNPDLFLTPFLEELEYIIKNNLLTEIFY